MLNKGTFHISIQLSEIFPTGKFSLKKKLLFLTVVHFFIIVSFNSIFSTESRIDITIFIFLSTNKITRTPTDTYIRLNALNLIIDIFVSFYALSFYQR